MTKDGRQEASLGRYPHVQTEKYWNNFLFLFKKSVKYKIQKKPFDIQIDYQEDLGSDAKSNTEICNKKNWWCKTVIDAHKN